MNRFVTRVLTIGVLLCTTARLIAQDAIGSASPGQTQTTDPTENAPQSGLPESPGAVQNNSQGNSPASTSSPTGPDTTQKPAGAAAAPAPQVTGNVVSRPAGSAIAPPKQRQVRSFLIKMGLIAGAGVALGTVAALSLSSPSRVPGSH